MTDIKFFYFRKPQVVKFKALPNALYTTQTHRGEPFACIAYKREPDPDVEGQDLVSFGWSCCNPEDEFFKSEARKIALEKLNNSRISGIVVDKCASNCQVLFDIVTQIYGDNKNGHRVRRAAWKWLNNV